MTDKTCPREIYESYSDFRSVLCTSKQINCLSYYFEIGHCDRSEYVIQYAIVRVLIDYVFELLAGPLFRIRTSSMGVSHQRPLYRQPFDKQLSGGLVRTATDYFIR